MQIARHLGICLLVLAGCRAKADPRATLEAAIAAHGGRERLQRFDQLVVESSGNYKGQLPFVRTLHYRAPDTWSMTIRAPDGATMAFGVEGARCWRKDRPFVVRCADADRKESARVTSLLGARFLHRLDPSKLSAGPMVSLEGGSAPSLFVGDMQLVFDPSSRYLRQIRFESSVESLSGFRDVDGVMVGTHRVLTIDGALDIDETWTQIHAGQSTSAEQLAPPFSEDGELLDEPGSDRAVVWTEVDDLESSAQAHKRLQEFARANGQEVSSSDGLSFSRSSEPGAPPRWRIALTLESRRPPPVHEGDRHMEVWRGERVLGIFHRGEVAGAFAREGSLERELRKRGLKPRAGARHEVLCAGACLSLPPRERLGFLRIAVEPAGE